jgi:hypothetical protein
MAWVQYRPARNAEFSGSSGRHNCGSIQTRSAPHAELWRYDSQLSHRCMGLAPGALRGCRVCIVPMR